MSTSLPTRNPTAYFGVRSTNPGQVYFKKDPPVATKDFRPYLPGDIWIDTVHNAVWILVKKTTTSGTWVGFSSTADDIEKITPSVGAAIVPTAGNVNLLGVNGVETTHSAVSSIQISNSSTLTPDSGVAVPFSLGNINIIGTAAQGITSTNGVNTVQFTVQDATTAAKGVSSYAAAEFNVAAGAVSLHGGLVLISSQTAANVASIIFNNIGAYKNYLLVISNVTPATNGEELFMQVSQDNGVTWIGAAHYQSGLNYSNYNSAVLTNKNANDSFYIAGAIENSNECDAIVYIQNVNMPDYIGIHGSSVWYDQVSGLTAYATFGGRSTTGINAFMLTMTAHNIDTGTFSLYGIKNT